MSTRTLAIAATLVLLSGGVSADARAGSPHSKSGPAPAATGAAAGPTNLEVLPKETSQADIVQLMVRYGQELNVQCQFCHVENPETQQVDFASDENPMKTTARIMIGMLSDINTKYLAQIGDRRYAVPLTCGNCHQGQTSPPPYEARIFQ